MTDKILFFTDLWFHNFGVAKYLQEHHDSELYGIFDVDDKAKEFFKNQKIVQYKKSWFYLDNVSKFNTPPDMNYLKSIEKKYNLDLWKIAYGDRFFNKYGKFHTFTETEIYSILEQECKFFEKVLDEVKPNFLSLYFPMLHYHELLKEICKSKGIKILMLGPVQFGHKMMVSQHGIIMDDFSDSKLPKTTMNLHELKKYKENYDSKQVIKDYKQTNFQSNFLQRYSSILKFFLSKQTSSNKKRYSHWGKNKSLVLQKKLSNRFQRILKTRFINKNSIQKIDSEIPFVYFPLHYEPERMLLLGAPFFDGQDDVVEKIAKSLPIDYELYVKIHPAQETIGFRPISYYKKLMDLPNVKLIHPSTSSDNLFEKCSLVVTINGTAGIEALFHGKPVVTLTDNFHSGIPCVKKISNFNELPGAINKAIADGVSEYDLNEFISKVEENTFDINAIKMESDFAYRFGLKGPVIDSELPQEDISKFIEDYSEQYEIMGKQHIKKIKQHNGLST